MRGEKTVYSDPWVLEDGQGTDINDSYYSEKSLAAADSLALSPESEVFVEHTLPSDGSIDYNSNFSIATAKNRRRRVAWIALVSLMIGIIVIVLSVVLTKQKNSNDRENSSQSIDSIEGSLQSEERMENEGDVEGGAIILEPESMPDIYYQLKAIVHNPAALLDTDTPEGKAFNVLVEEFETQKSPTTRSIDYLDLQRYALLVFYFGTDGGSWTSTDGWATPSGECEDWTGVTCQKSLVRRIDLDKNNLHGRIPEDFCLIEGLQYLKLSGNKVELPSCISNLSSLEELDFKGNNFAGELPIWLHSMPSVTLLDLSDNKFEGSIDMLFPQLSRGSGLFFPKLRTLNLANNKLRGEIPENMLRRMSNLDELILYGNTLLSGSLNELCKGDGISLIEADCNNVFCKCCTSGNNCPSSL